MYGGDELSPPQWPSLCRAWKQVIRTTSSQPSLGRSKETDLGNLCVSVLQSVLMNINTRECGLSLIIACNVIFLMKIKCFRSTK